MLLLLRHGRLRLGHVMQYAIGYAGEGSPMLGSASAAVAAVAGTFRDHWPSSAEVYLRGGSAPARGSRFTNPDLAAAYTRILVQAEGAGGDREAQIETARLAFYEGFVAEAIAAYLERVEVMDVTGRRHRSLLTAPDLASWRAPAEAPVTLDYQGLTVCKTGPWGQGPASWQQLALLDGLGVAGMDPARPAFPHTLIESAKLAFPPRQARHRDPRSPRRPPPRPPSPV